MEPLTVQAPAQQEYAQETAPRKRVRNSRNKLSQPSTLSAADNDSTKNVLVFKEPDIKTKSSNDKADAVVKNTTVKQKEEVPAKNKQPSPMPNVQTSSKSSGTTSSKNSNQGSPKPDIRVPSPLITDGQSSQKEKDQAPPPITRGNGSPKSNGQALSIKTNPKTGSGSKNKRRRNKRAGFNAENSKVNVSGGANKSDLDFSKNGQVLMKDNKDNMENQASYTMIVSTKQETETDSSSNNQPIVVNGQVLIVEKHEVIEPTKEDIVDKELRANEGSTNNQHGPQNSTGVIEQDKSGSEQQIAKERSVSAAYMQRACPDSPDSLSCAEGDKATEEINSSETQDQSVEGSVKESHSEKIAKVEEEKVELVSSNELSKAEEEKTFVIEEFEELKVADNEKNTPKEKVEKTEKGITKRGLPAGCLFVASLPSTKSDGELQKSVWNHFSRWGILLNVKVLKDWLFRPYSFVQFENVYDARKALVEAHNTVIDGRHIRVEQARVNRTLFIGRLNRTMNEEDIRKLLEPYGTTEDIHLLRTYSTGKSRGCAFVKFCYRDDAIRAYMNLRQHNSNYVIEWAANLEKAVPGPEDIDKRSIFVGQLNQVEVTKESLAEKFSRYGGIKEIQYVARKFLRISGPPRNAFAFIYYNDEESSKKAIEAENNTKYFDRIIRVQYRESQEFRNQQIQSFRQQQEIRRRAFQESYYNAAVSSGRQPRPPPLSRGPNYYTNSQKTSNRRNSSIQKEMPVMSTSVFYPQVSMGAHHVVPNTNVMSGPNMSGIQDSMGKSTEVSHMQNNANMIQPELMYYPPPPVPTSIPTSVGMIPTFAGSPQEFTMPPYIHTPEGLAYPYAPSMAFMGTINHNSGASYIRDISHETINAPVSKVPLPPNILHSYVPPYVPGQPVNEYGFAEVAGQSAQYCGVPIPFQITMPPPMYFYPSQPMDPMSSCSQTLESASGYEADIEISTHVVDEEKTAVGKISKEVPSSSKIFDNRIYADVSHVQESK